MAQRTESYACQGCGVSVTRDVARGQRPKWCAACRKNPRTTTPCPVCGTPVARRATYCSPACCGRSRVKPRQLELPAPIDQRGPLRRAIDDGDHAAALVAIRARVQVSDSGCWIWPRTRDGYPEYRTGDRVYAVHRLALESRHGASLGSQSAHHMCAVTACVNPDHLQPVTHRDNVAEMLARRSYLARIRDLEGALSEVAPDHPLLGVVALA